MDINHKYKLNNGIEIPALGIGTYRSQPGRETVEAIEFALELGYRHIDTAAMYGNEKEVGQVIRESGIKREEIFVTTKLWNDDHGFKNTLSAFDRSYKNLNIDYIDLYLIHWPVTGRRVESWKALEKLYGEGIVKAIGVSNYTIRHLQETLNNSEIKPAVNQVEMHPFLYQKDLIDFCEKHDVRIEAYSPLTRGTKFKDPVIISFVEKYGKTPAQIMIRWALQNEFVVLPKSVHQNRIKENSEVFDFEISESDMAILNELNNDFRITWDPSNVE